METTDLNDLIKLYYQTQSYDDTIGDDVIKLTPIVNYEVFSKVTSTSLTAFFKFKELGVDNVKRFYTIKFDFDFEPNKTVVIEYKGNKYKVLKIEIKEDEKTDFIMYDAELIVGDGIE